MCYAEFNDIIEAIAALDADVLSIEAAGEHQSPDQIWVNPDCGLKTRRWEEVEPTLAIMVAAAERMRE